MRPWIQWNRARDNWTVLKIRTRQDIPRHGQWNESEIATVLSLKVSEGYPDRQAPDEGQRAQWLKCLDDSNKDEDNSPLVINVNNFLSLLVNFCIFEFCHFCLFFSILDSFFFFFSFFLHLWLMQGVTSLVILNAYRHFFFFFFLSPVMNKTWQIFLLVIFWSLNKDTYPWIYDCICLFYMPCPFRMRAIMALHNFLSFVALIKFITASVPVYYAPLPGSHTSFAQYCTMGC